jgi:hypothetical protein
MKIISGNGSFDFSLSSYLPIERVLKTIFDLRLYKI